MELDDFLKQEWEAMIKNLEHTVRYLSDTMTANPDDYIEDGCDSPSIDIRLCVDLSDDGGSWIFRTGDASYDQHHSQFCSASCVTPTTDYVELLNELSEGL